LIKKIFIAIIIFSLISPLLFFMGSKCYLVWHHQTINRQFSMENSCTITVNNANAQWIDNGKELIINNNYIDVDYIVSFTDSTITINGIWDEMETKLEQTILIQEKNDPINNLLCLVIKLVNGFCWENQSAFALSTFCIYNKTKKETILYTSNDLNTGFKGKLLKPPSLI
jgi:hypothetical protein